MNVNGGYVSNVMVLEDILCPDLAAILFFIYIFLFPVSKHKIIGSGTAIKKGAANDFKAPVLPY